jgi:two-component system, cell cycle response regulator DivK
MASILLVEDALDISYLVVLLLHSAGHTVVSVNDGVSAVQRATQELPDLIIMDLALPQLDGWEATRQLKAQVSTRHIPVLAFTAHVLSDDIEHALAVGCAAVIRKPFEITIFLDTIDDLLHTRNQRTRTLG